MKVTADTLLRGSAAIDRMEGEITKVIKLLFWLTRNNPKLWIHRHTLKSEYGWDLRTQFGVLEPTKAVWEVWYGIGDRHTGFRARCVYLKDVASKPTQVFTTAPRDEAVLKPISLIDCDVEVSPAGILIARDNLDIFVEGMMSQFPLGVVTKPYIEAATRA